MSKRRAAFNASLTGSAAPSSAPPVPANTTPAKKGRDLPPALSHPRAHAHVTNNEVERAAQSGRKAGGKRGDSAEDTVADTGELEQATAELAVSSSGTPTAGDDSPSAASTSSADGQQVADPETCFICAEPIIYYAVGVCGHRTCHICAIRLRVFYKKTYCTFCKTDLPNLLFTSSPDTPFPLDSPADSPPGAPPGSLDLSKFQHSDAKLGVVFEDADMMDATLLLLRFNCPSPTCSFMAAGWDGLEKHTLAAHGSVLCGLCRRQLSRFAHEQVLYPPHLLALHDPSQLKRGQRKPVPRGRAEEELVATWGEPHPMCEFCHEAFFSSDELFKHMRNRHEECFVCKAAGQPALYFMNYPKLEQHFNDAHFPCTEKECQEKKFVVFGSEMDLRAHMMAEHKSTMSSRDKHNARHVPIEFTSLGGDYSFIPPTPNLRASTSNGASGSRGGQRQAEPASQFSAPRRNQISRDPVQSQQLAQPVTGANRRAAFGGSLSTNNQLPPSSEPTSRAPSGKGKARDGTETPREPVDERTAARHADLLARFSAMVEYSDAKISSFRHAIRSFRNNESGAKDMVDTVYSILERDTDATLRLMREVATLMSDDKSKEQAIFTAVNAFKVDRQNEFPSLGPTSVGTEFAGITSGKVLSAKRATQTSSNQIWDRVERAATSAPAHRPANSGIGTGGRTVPGAVPAFPALGSGSSKKAPAPQPTTGWANRAQTTVAMPLVTMPPQPRSVNYASNTNGKGKGVALSNSAFPGLPPTSSKGLTSEDRKALFGQSSRQESIKRLTGDAPSPPPTNWATSQESSAAQTPDEAKRAGGKKKKQQKEVLFSVNGW